MPHSKKDMPNPCTCEYDLIWKQGFCRYIQHIVQMYSRGGLGWVLIRGGDEDADTHGGRDTGTMPHGARVASANGGTPKMPAIPVAKTRAWNGVSPGSSREHIPVSTLISGFQNRERLHFCSF